MTSTRIERVQRLLLGLVLASGGAFVWMLIVAETTSWISEQILRRTPSETFTLWYRQSGEPVWHHTRYSSPQVVATRAFETLDGETVRLSQEEINQSSHRAVWIWPFSEEPSFYQRERPHEYRSRLIDLPQPLPWSVRLWNCSANFDHYGQWLMVWPERWSGSVYLAGFDPKAKVSRGFIGRNGWQETRPTDAEGFPVGQLPSDGHGLRVARVNGVHDFSTNISRLMVLEEDRNSDVGMLWLNPQQTELSLINLSKGSVEIVRKFSDVPLRGIFSSWIDHTDARTVLSANSGTHLRSNVILLWPDHLEFVTPAMQTLSKVTLPEELRERDFNLTKLADGQFLGQWSKPEISKRVFESHFFWFTDAGEVTQRCTFKSPPPLPWTAWQQWANEWQSEPYPPATMMPLGLTSWGLQWLRDRRHENLLFNKPTAQPTFWEFLRSSPWTIGLTLLSGLPFAVACWRRQRRVASTTCEQIVWPVLVYLFGLAGWIAFATHRNWPARRAPMSGRSHSPDA